MVRRLPTRDGYLSLGSVVRVGVRTWSYFNLRIRKTLSPKLMTTRTYLASGLPVPLYPPRRVTPDIAMVGDPNTGGMLVGETYLILIASGGCRLPAAYDHHGILRTAVGRHQYGNAAAC
jgi:hypothetical protein